MKAYFDIPLIKKSLQRGEIGKLAKESGISTAYAYRCLSEKDKAFHYEFMMKCHDTIVERACILQSVHEKEQSLKTVLQ